MLGLKYKLIYKSFIKLSKIIKIKLQSNNIIKSIYKIINMGMHKNKNWTLRKSETLKLETTNMAGVGSLQ